jgi:hypothetical protein
MADYEKLIKQTEATRFKKGKTGNAGGRRKTDWKLIHLARESVPDAFIVARKVMLDEGEVTRERLDAAKFLTAYGLGTPSKVMPEPEGEDVGEALGELSVDELRSLARQSLEDDAPEDDAGDDDSDEETH